MRTVDFAKLNLQEGDRVLDLGCGEGRHMHAVYFAKEEIQAVGVDLLLEDVQKARKGFLDFPDLDPSSPRSFGFSVGDALKLPFADGTFDKVICSEVLEHIPDYLGAVKEINRVLKPGGTFGVSVPRFWPERICWALSEDYHNTPGGHVRIFRESQLRGAVQAQGLSFLKRHWAHGLHSPYWWIRCAVGVRDDKNFFVRTYHRFLAWDIVKRPLLTRLLEKIADPLMGKSVVMYFHKSLPKSGA